MRFLKMSITEYKKLCTIFVTKYTIQTLFAHCKDSVKDINPKGNNDFLTLQKIKHCSIIPHFHIQNDTHDSFSDINVSFKNTAIQCCHLGAIKNFYTLQKCNTNHK